MDRSTNSTMEPIDFYHALRRYPKRWLVPTLSIGALSVVYAFFHPANWEASQALIVRDEAIGSAMARPGEFTHTEGMKTSQETILELAKSRPVLWAALEDVGPPAGSTVAANDWPNLIAVEVLQSALKIVPPKGAEFGKTELFYLKVQSRNCDRAIALAGSVARQLQARFEKLREAKARGVTQELERTVSLAEAELNASTVALATVERNVGVDLADLRMLNESPSGESTLRKTSLELDAELRTHRAAQSTNRELLALLEHAQDDPGRLLASPSRLLEAQPALKRLKDGLVDAQLKTAALVGSMSPEHPMVISARDAEQEISNHLHGEIAIAIRGIKLDQRLTDDRVATLEKQREDIQRRFDKLASLRAEYSNLAATVKHRTDILKTAQTELADSRASQAAANASSLITLVDSPDAGGRTVGPGRKVIALGGMLFGLLTGLGILFLTVHPTHLGFRRGGEFIGDGKVAVTSGASNSGGGLSLHEAVDELGESIQSR